VAVVVVLPNGKKTANPPASTAAYADGILTVAGQRYELASIPPGTFQMGSDSAAAIPGEHPVHPVTISGFRMGRTEVTQGVWRAVMGSNPASFQNGDNYPVENISWEDCRSFITRLNQLVGGNTFRLPSEAEWEYACRATTAGDRYGELNSVAWYEVNSGSSTHPVGQKQANAWGLYDMLGNVWEWCQDWYDEYYYAHSPGSDPQGPVAGSRRVDRGGGWDNGAQYVRAAFRYSIGPAERYHALGFRLASD
jgi:formylglycine-generating enzyme required for sulfatase activity